MILYIFLQQVPIPEDLDLDSWINDPPSDSSDSEEMDMNEIFVKTDGINDDIHDKPQSYEPSVEEIESMREARKLEQQNNPHYLKNSKTVPKKLTFYDKSDENYENIPIAELDIPVSLKVSNSVNSDKYFNMDRKRHKKNKKNKSRKSNDK